jgi:hypothetical protein
MFLHDVAEWLRWFQLFRASFDPAETTETTEPLRDIALKHRLSTNAQWWNRGEKDVYFCAGRREDRAGIGTATSGGITMELSSVMRP